MIKTSCKNISPFLALSMALLLLTSAPVRAGGGPQNVVLLINPQSLEAKQVGHHYQQARGIPDQNVIYMDPVPDSFLHFSEQHREVLLGTLLHRGILDHIDYVVIPAADAFFVPASGIVHDGCSPITRFSLSSIYAMTFLTDYLLTRAPNVSLSLRNHYFSDTAVPAAFSSAVTWLNGEVNASNGRRYYLGAVLGYRGERGNSAEEIIEMIDRTVQADGSRPIGTTYYMETTDDARSAPRHDGFPAAVDAIEAEGGQAEHLMDVLPLERHDCLGIMTGWAVPGIMDADLTLEAGSFCDHMTSFAATFNTASQEKVSAWIAKGASGSYGTVQEPCNYAGKFPTAQLHLYYFQGCSLGEAVYRSVRYVPFQGLVYGDPLARPFAFIPLVTVDGLPTEDVSGSIEIDPVVTTDAPQATIARVDLLVDGVVQVSGSGESPLMLDTDSLSDGCHDVFVSAIDDTLVASQGSWTGTLCTRNHGRDAGVIVAPTKGDLGTLFGFSMSAGGGDVTELRLMANGRVIASASGGGGDVFLRGRDFGPGIVRCYVEAEFADGSLARSARVSVNVEAAGAASPTPDPPIAFGYRSVVSINEPTIIELPATNPDGTDLTFVIAEQPSQASIWRNGPVVFLHPKPQASGIDSLAFFVADADASSPTVTITLDFRHVFGDLTGDAHVDLRDFQWLQTCFGSIENESCEHLGVDFDEVDGIDLKDLILFVDAITGPG